MSQPDTAIKLTNLRHCFQDRTRRFVLHMPDLSIPAGEWLSVLGPSGCGKSTLQNVLGLVREPHFSDPLARKTIGVDSFVVNERKADSNSGIAQHDVAAMMAAGKAGKRAIANLASRCMGYCLQTGELLPTLTIKENVAMPLRLNGWSARDAERRVDEVLGFLLSAKEYTIHNKLALEISGGQYQRVAFARALVHSPKVVLIDEPTSSLDPPNARRALDLLANEVAHQDTTVIMVTHNESLARDYSDFIVRMDSPEEPWGDAIPLRFREGDGWGTAVRFERKQPAGWQETDSTWQPVSTLTEEPTYVA
ncbi:MAG: ATP-binding cassette domain-containing protein [Planctomycetota bacterium]